MGFLGLLGPLGLALRDCRHFPALKGLGLRVSTLNLKARHAFVQALGVESSFPLSFGRSGFRVSRAVLDKEFAFNSSVCLSPKPPKPSKS